MDMDVTTDNDGTCFVGWTTAGEWLDFEITSNSNGEYDLVLRTATQQADKRVTLTIDGAEVGSAVIPSDGWTTYNDVIVSKVGIATGEHTLRITFDLSLIHISEPTRPY